jgi:hypothetical protein
MIQASPFVREAEVDGNVTLMDLSRGDYLSFDPIGSLIWKYMSRGRHDDSEICDLLFHQFDVDLDRLRGDIQVFRTECLAKGLLCDNGGSEIQSRRRPLTRIFGPSFTAWYWLLEISLSLKRHGFAATYTRAVNQAPEVTGKPDLDRLAIAAAAFRRAEIFFVARQAPNDCLSRSLALFAFLRAMGLPAEHRIGYEPYPFNAHAWVECGGSVVLDADRRSSLTPFRQIA